jgi:3-oxoacyl-[acyl-carrier protein] reductase
VAINSRDAAKVKAAAEKITRETGTQSVGLAGDVSDASVPEKLIQGTVDAFGGLDILITNASGPTSGSIDSLDEAAWRKGIDLCLMSHVRLIKAALPHLRKSDTASVLTITSYTVKQPIPNVLISNSVRAATVGLTKSLALELGRENIRFNSIMPGWTMTGRVDELMASRAKTNSTTVEEEIAKQTADIPLGRMGRPEEFANAAVFLVSPAASFVHGALLAVDGGVIKGTF